MEFQSLLLAARSGEESSIVRIFEMYEPLIRKESEINGTVNEDLYQEQCIMLLKCIKMFSF